MYSCYGVTTCLWNDYNIIVSYMILYYVRNDFNSECIVINKFIVLSTKSQAAFTHVNVEKRPGRNASHYTLLSVGEEIYRRYFLVAQHHFGNNLHFVGFDIARQQFDFSVLKRNGQVRVNRITTQMRSYPIEVFAAYLQNDNCRQTPGHIDWRPGAFTSWLVETSHTCSTSSLLTVATCWFAGSTYAKCLTFIPYTFSTVDLVCVISSKTPLWKKSIDCSVIAYTLGTPVSTKPFQTNNTGTRCTRSHRHRFWTLPLIVPGVYRHSTALVRRRNHEQRIFTINSHVHWI